MLGPNVPKLSSRYERIENTLAEMTPDPLHPDGGMSMGKRKQHINIMPRFIMGYSTDIADTLAGGAPTEEYKRRHGEMAYREKKVAYKNAERRAKWCTLIECAQQASDIRYIFMGFLLEFGKDVL